MSKSKISISELFTMAVVEKLKENNIQYDSINSNFLMINTKSVLAYHIISGPDRATLEAVTPWGRSLWEYYVDIKHPNSIQEIINKLIEELNDEKPSYNRSNN